MDAKRRAKVSSNFRILGSPQIIKTHQITKPCNSGGYIIVVILALLTLGIDAGCVILLSAVKFFVIFSIYLSIYIIYMYILTFFKSVYVAHIKCSVNCSLLLTL